MKAIIRKVSVLLMGLVVIQLMYKQVKWHRLHCTTCMM